MKLGIESALDRLSEQHPVFRFAVVFDSTRWHPAQPPDGSQWDYEPFTREDIAREALAESRDGESEPELWERRSGQWQQVA